jgi:hypothetical protein
MTTTEKYNGWTNYETWAVHLWLTGEQGSSTYWNQLANATWANPPKNQVWNRSESARYTLADMVKAHVEAGAPEMEPSLYLDLLNSAIEEARWDEIADALLSDCEGYERRG